MYYSGYTWLQLKPLQRLMLECCTRPEKHHSAVFDKYSDRRYKRAAIFVKTEMENGFVLPMNAPSARPSLSSADDKSSPAVFEGGDSYKRMVQVKG